MRSSDRTPSRSDGMEPSWQVNQCDSGYLPKHQPEFDEPQARLCARLCLGDFLCISTPSIIPAADGDTDEAFLERLGMARSAYNHHILERLKDDIRAERRQSLSSLHCLVPKLQNDSTLQPPFSADQISEMAIKKAMLRVYDRASPEVKGICDIAGTREDNWVIRWMIFREIEDSCRRPLATSAASPAAICPDSSSSFNQPDQHTSALAMSTGIDVVQRSPVEGRSHYWDPVRGLE